MKVKKKVIFIFSVIFFFNVINPLVLNATAPADAPYKVAFSVTNQQVLDFIKASDPTFKGKAKLVYINGTQENGGDLHYIDFSEGSGEPVVRKIAAVSGAFVPVISPDGKWVVFAKGKGAEGHLSEGPSSAYICKLEADAIPVLISDGAHEPRFKQNAEKLTVIYGTRSGQETWNKPDPGKTMQVEIDVSGTTPKIGQPTVLFEHASLMGGLSYDNKYLCSAGGLACMIDLTSEKTKVDTVNSRFPLKRKTEEWPAGVQPGDVLPPSKAKLLQACNPSISSSRSLHTNAMMYIDFGTPLMNDLINGGKSWAQWQIIFVCNIHGQTLWHMRVPANDPVFPYNEGIMSEDMSKDTVLDVSYTRWHHPEWSNHPYFAVATINLRRLWGQDQSKWRETERQERINIIDIKNKKTLNILRPALEELKYTTTGTGLFYPWLWIEVSNDFVEASDFLPVIGQPNKPDSRKKQQLFIYDIASIEGSVEKINVVLPNGSIVMSLNKGKNRSIDLSKLRELKQGAYFIQAVLNNNTIYTTSYLSF